MTAPVVLAFYTPTKGLDETGVWKLMDMGNLEMRHPTVPIRSETLACDIYDSPFRR